MLWHIARFKWVQFLNDFLYKRDMIPLSHKNATPCFTLEWLFSHALGSNKSISGFGLFHALDVAQFVLVGFKLSPYDFNLALGPLQ